MNEIILFRPSFDRIKNAVGTVVGETVLVIAEQASRAGTLSFQILVALRDIAGDTAASSYFRF